MDFFTKWNFYGFNHIIGFDKFNHFLQIEERFFNALKVPILVSLNLSGTVGMLNVDAPQGAYATRQPCPAALPGSLARQPLPGSLARMPCPHNIRSTFPAALPGQLTFHFPGNLARQPCRNITSLITGRHAAWHCILVLSELRTDFTVSVFFFTRVCV
jgi:hypothetical protein